MKEGYHFAPQSILSPRAILSLLFVIPRARGCKWEGLKFGRFCTLIL